LCVCSQMARDGVSREAGGNCLGSWPPGAAAGQHRPRPRQRRRLVTITALVSLVGCIVQLLQACGVRERRGQGRFLGGLQRAGRASQVSWRSGRLYFARRGAEGLSVVRGRGGKSVVDDNWRGLMWGRGSLCSSLAAVPTRDGTPTVKFFCGLILIQGCGGV
jgi:hypothetical protein